VQGLAFACELLGDACRSLGVSETELATAQESLALRRRLAIADASSTNAQLRVALSHMRIGYALQAEGVISPAREQFQTAATMLEKLDNEKRLSNAKQTQMLMRELQSRLLQCEVIELAARQDLSEVDKLPASARATTLTTLAIMLVQQGRHADAVAAADRMLQAGEPAGNQLYDAGRIYAMCVPVTDEAEVKGRYAVRATELLRQATQRGIAQSGRLRLDPALEPVRDRPDFPKS